jgi:hypothetical protein
MKRMAAGTNMICSLKNTVVVPYHQLLTYWLTTVILCIYAHSVGGEDTSSTRLKHWNYRPFDETIILVSRASSPFPLCFQVCYLTVLLTAKFTQHRLYVTEWVQKISGMIMTFENLSHCRKPPFHCHFVHQQSHRLARDWTRVSPPPELRDFFLLYQIGHKAADAIDVFLLQNILTIPRVHSASFSKGYWGLFLRI